MPPTIPDLKITSINSPNANKIKGNKKNLLLLISMFLLILVMVIGIVAISINLQQKPISEKAKASVWQGYAGQEKCGITFVQAIESPICEDLTAQTNLTPINPSKKNDVSNYVVTYTIKNTSGQSHTVKYSKSGYYCQEPYGQLKRNFGCWEGGTDGVEETITLASGETKIITVSVSSTSKQVCGSYQTDFAILNVDGDANCAYKNDYGETLTSTSTCQTGNTCTEPTVPPTVPPSIPPTVPPTIPPTVPPTIPPTVPPTVPPTIPPTVPPTIPPTSPPSSTATPKPTSSACIQVVPNIPQGVGIEIINNNQCKFSWNEVSNVTGYQISWGENPNGEGKPNVNLGKLLTYTFDCPELTTKTYYFKVRAMNECAEGTFSNIVHAGSWPTPTEIILAKTTSGATAKPITPSIPSAGVAQFGFLLIPLGIILMALIL